MSLQDSASEATVLINDNNVSIEADGYIGGVDMVVEFTGSNLVLDLANSDVAEYIVNDDNTARILMAGVIGLEQLKDVITVTEGTITAINELSLVTTEGDLYVPMNDENVNVLDIVTLVNCVLAENCADL